MSLKERLQVAMAQRRKEERARKAELHRLDNEEDAEEEEEEEMTDSEEEVKPSCNGRCNKFSHMVQDVYILLLSNEWKFISKMMIIRCAVRQLNLKHI